MAGDPATIDLERTGLLGQSFAADDKTGLGLDQVFAAQLADGNCIPFLKPLLGRVEPAFDFAEKAPGFAAGLVRSQSPILANGKATRSALTIAKLDQE